VIKRPKCADTSAKDCWCKLNDTPEAIEKNADRIALEAELERKTPVDVIGEGQSVGSMSAARDM
jgi:hypothetical protein